MALGRTVDTMEDASSISPWRSEGKPPVEPLCCDCWLDCPPPRAISVLLCVLIVLVVCCRRPVFLVANGLLFVVGSPRYRRYVSVVRYCCFLSLFCCRTLLTCAVTYVPLSTAFACQQFGRVCPRCFQSVVSPLPVCPSVLSTQTHY